MKDEFDTEFSDDGDSPDVPSDWIGATVSASYAAAFIEAGVSVDQAREWVASEVTASDAVQFIRGGVPPATAAQWLKGTEFAADDIVDFIAMGASLQQAMDFDRRGIGAHQVSRTDAGLEFDLDPWQEDPADQLPKVITPGPVNMTLWTTALGGDPVAHDVHFTWDGGHTADWYEDISMDNGGLSVMSSSPARGVLAWPNGKDVVLTYRWSDMGLEGHDLLPGMAPTNGEDASDPERWLSLADAIIDFVLLDLGSRDSEDAHEYLDTLGDFIVEIHEIFRDFLSTDAATEGDFGEWIEEQVAAGRYVVLGEDDEN